MTVPSILSVYGIVLGYLSENKTDDFDLWNQKIILTPMLFVAFWSLTDPWSKIIVDLSSIPSLVGLIGVILVSIGVLASGYLATGGVGAYLASVSAGAVMGIGASFVAIQSLECLRKYFRIKLLIAFTLKNIAFSLGYIIVPSLTHSLLTQVNFKIALLLITIIFIPTTFGVILLRRPLSQESSQYNLLLPNMEDNEIPTKYLSSINVETNSVENETDQQVEYANTSFAGVNEIYTYEDSEEDIFVNPATMSSNNLRHQFRIFKYFRIWMIVLTWIGIRSFSLFFWILLPFMFITKIPSSYDYVTVSTIAGIGTLLPSLSTSLIIQASPQNRRLFFGTQCWFGCIALVVLSETTEYHIFMVCAVLGGISIGGLLACQDSLLCDILGPRFMYQSHKAFSTVVGMSLLSLCFIHDAKICFYVAASLLFLSGCYWIWVPIINILKYKCITCFK